MAKKSTQQSTQPISADAVRDALRAGEGFDLSAVDPSSTPAFDGDKAAAEALLPALADEASDLQERLYAQSKSGSNRKILLVIQGMDTAGKGGIMRHVVGAMDPQGSEITAFKAPTKEELAHHFLWRIRKALPEAGKIGVFDRSHYEDVLIVRVRGLVPQEEWEGRYAQINDFEQEVADDDTTIIKIMLHISSQEQKDRLMERLDRPDKHWKFNPGDIDERQEWDDYMAAYEAAVQRCSTPVAPWYVVPADRKWYARLAVMNILLAHLRDLDLQWPEAQFDVEEQKARLAAT
ncbi:MAG TPA: polyphosphate kinase 2 family protein [Intrasporangiaceae bacterium]|nr:polyphosphate kinase 2 family protein [Intrasporangiaceae bacterium]